MAKLETTSRTRPTIFTVAKEAGVSITTVSHITNYPGKHEYSSATAEKVLQACRKLGYQPNSLARSLAKRNNPAIGVLCDSLTDVNITRAVDRIVELAAANGRHVVVTTQPAKVPWADLLNEGKVSWIIAINRYLVDQSKDLMLPGSMERIVPVSPGMSQERPFTHAVTWDPGRMGILAAEHLAELGHRQIAILSGIFTDPDQTTPRIRAAYYRALELGMTVHWITNEREVDNEISASGRIMTREVLEKYPNVTGIICRQDYHVLGVYHELHRAGRRIPDDVAVVGHFNLQDIFQFCPPLTSTYAPLMEGIEAAFNFVLSECQGPNQLVDLTDRIRLVVRESTLGKEREELGEGKGDEKSI